MIAKLIAAVPPLVNIGVYYFNRQKSNAELKNICIMIQLMLTVAVFIAFGFIAGIFKLFQVGLFKICPAGLLRFGWIVSCIFDVFQLLSIIL